MLSEKSIRTVKKSSFFTSRTSSALDEVDRVWFFGNPLKVVAPLFIFGVLARDKVSVINFSVLLFQFFFVSLGKMHLLILRANIK